MGCHKKVPINPDEPYLILDSTLVNQTINSQLTFMASEFFSKPKYTDYVYNKEFLNDLMEALGPLSSRVNIREIKDDNGNFFCWEVSTGKQTA